MEWKPGFILRIKNYKFENDNSTRDKYAIVLYANNEGAYLIHTLTTSQNNLAVPGSNFGCSVYKGIPYYFIPKGQVIGDQQYFFDKDTFIFFLNNVRKESYGKLEKAAESVFGVTNLGILSNEELKRLLKCVLKSRFIPFDLAAELLAFKETL